MKELKLNKLPDNLITLVHHGSTFPGFMKTILKFSVAFQNGFHEKRLTALMVYILKTIIYCDLAGNQHSVSLSNYTASLDVSGTKDPTSSKEPEHDYDRL